MTSPPSPALSETLSSCCSLTEGHYCSHSEASSPELKRAKRQNMRTRLEDIFVCRLNPLSPTGTKDDGTNSILDHTSQISFTSMDNDQGHNFKESSRSNLGKSQNLCCSLPDINVIADNECKGLDLDCSCCSHSVSAPTEVSLELRSDRRDKVVTSYYSHFKQIRSTSFLQSEMSKVESDDDVEAADNISNMAEAPAVLYPRNNEIASANRDSVAEILEDDGPLAPRSFRTVETEISKGGHLSPEMVARGDQCDSDIAVMPALSDRVEDDHGNAVEIDSIDGSLSGNGEAVEDSTSLLPAQNSPKCIECNGQMMDTQKTPAVDSNAPAGENTGNIETLSPIESLHGTSKVSPAGESFPMTLNEMERSCENPSAESLFSEILDSSKHFENGLETSQDSKNDTGRFLGSRRIENEFKSELEFSTVLTLAYVRVRDLTNNIDKAQEYLGKIDNNDDEDDLIELRFKIQAMFDSRAAMSLEQAKWRSQFSANYQQRKRALSSLKSRACRTEQAYFQLRKELIDLEKEPIIPKRKRNLFSKLFSFRFAK